MAISRRSFLKTSAAVGTLAAFEANLGANLTFSKSNSKFVPSV
ncbi:MAG: twin-arginine translocation signal domain-containing protein, partial [Campylobacter hyointestinalis]